MFEYYRKIVGISTIVVNAMNNWQDVYSIVWEKFGVEKKILLEDYRKKINNNQEEFPSFLDDAFKKIRLINDPDTINLDKFYHDILKEFENYEKQADNVHEKVKAINYIAQELFKEWKNESSQINNIRLKVKSVNLLNINRKRFSELYEKLEKEDTKVNPILKNLKDFVTYLKHQLNNKFTDNLYKEIHQLKIEIENLNNNMIQSIKSAKTFAEIQKGK